MLFVVCRCSLLGLVDFGCRFGVARCVLCVVCCWFVVVVRRVCWLLLVAVSRWCPLFAARC